MIILVSGLLIHRATLYIEHRSWRVHLSNRLLPVTHSKQDSEATTYCIYTVKRVDL